MITRLNVAGNITVICSCGCSIEAHFEYNEDNIILGDNLEITDVYISPCEKHQEIVENGDVIIPGDYIEDVIYEKSKEEGKDFIEFLDVDAIEIKENLEEFAGI